MFEMKGKKWTIIAIIIIILGLTAGLLSYFMISGHDQNKDNTHKYDVCNNAVVRSFGYYWNDNLYDEFVNSHTNLAKPPKMAYCSPSGDRYLKWIETDDGQYDVVDMVIYEYDAKLEHATKNNGEYEIKARCLSSAGWSSGEIDIFQLDYICDNVHYNFM